MSETRVLLQGAVKIFKAGLKSKTWDIHRMPQFITTTHCEGCETCDAYTLHIVKASESSTVEIPSREVKKAFRIAWPNIQWLTKLSQCLVLLDYSLNSFDFKTYINKVLVHQKKNLIRAMQPSRNYVILIRGDEDMGNSNQGPIDSVLWDGIGTIRIWCSIYYITCNPW